MDRRFIQILDTIAQAAQVSSGFNLPRWTRFAGIHIPNADLAIFTLQVSLDGGSNYAPVLDPADGADLEVVASGEDPGFMDVSQYIMGLPHGSNKCKLRLYSSAAQNTAALTITVFARE